MDKAEIEKRFTYVVVGHPPKGNQPDRYQEIRTACRSLTQTIVSITPESREQALAITKIEEACFWANAAIARNEV
jgi:hypothetical protein